MPLPARAGARWPLVVAALAFLVVQLQPAAVRADHGGRDIGTALRCDRPVTPPRCTSVGDDRRHYVLFDTSLTPELADAMRAAMTNAYGATKLSMIEQARRTARTDVVAFSGDYGDNGAAAWVYCPTDEPHGTNPSGERWCRGQHLVFNLNPRYAVFFDDQPSREHVACHEIGHTIGLRHWGNPPQSAGPVGETCMNANTPNGPTRLHPTDIDHINAYPYRVARTVPAPPIPDVDASRLTPHAQPHVAQAPGALARDPRAGWLAGTSEAERPTSLAELVESADLVAVGRVESVTGGRTFGPPSHRLTYASVGVALVEVLAGEPVSSQAHVVTVEEPMLDGPSQLERLQRELVGTQRLLFLRNKGASAAEAGLPAEDVAADRPFYRLVTFGSEITDVGGLARPALDELGLLDRFADRPFDEAVAEIRRFATGR